MNLFLRDAPSRRARRTTTNCRLSCEKVGIQLDGLEDWTCCGARRDAHESGDRLLREISLAGGRRSRPRDHLQRLCITLRG